MKENTVWLSSPRFGQIEKTNRRSSLFPHPQQTMANSSSLMVIFFFPSHLLLGFPIRLNLTVRWTWSPSSSSLSFSTHHSIPIILHLFRYLSSFPFISHVFGQQGKDVPWDSRIPSRTSFFSSNSHTFKLFPPLFRSFHIIELHLSSLPCLSCSSSPFSSVSLSLSLFDDQSLIPLLNLGIQVLPRLTAPAPKQFCNLPPFAPSMNRILYTPGDEEYNRNKKKWKEEEKGIRWEMKLKHIFSFIGIETISFLITLSSLLFTLCFFFLSLPRILTIILLFLRWINAKGCRRICSGRIQTVPSLFPRLVQPEIYGKTENSG